jgi:hypothetical protein
LVEFCETYRILIYRDKFQYLFEKNEISKTKLKCYGGNLKSLVVGSMSSLEKVKKSYKWQVMKTTYLECIWPCDTQTNGVILKINK